MAGGGRKKSVRNIRTMSGKRRTLKGPGYNMRENRKVKGGGADHPDRNAQGIGITAYAVIFRYPFARFFAAFPDWSRKKCAQIHKINPQFECWRDTSAPLGLKMLIRAITQRERKLTTKAHRTEGSQAHKGRIKSENLFLRVPLCARTEGSLVVYILLPCFSP
jgi:hypothetical protein